MGLFGKAQSSAPPSPAPVEPRQGQVPPSHPASPPAKTGATVIAREADVKGEITGSGEFVIEGRLEGELRCDGNVTVVETGRVKGNLHGRSVRVAGSVEGDVWARERVELTASGRLTGNITAPRMHIAEGAAFEGQVFMRKPGAPQPEKKAPERDGDGDSAGSRGDRRNRKGGA